MRRMRWLPALGFGLLLTGYGADRSLAQPESRYPHDLTPAAAPGSPTGLTAAPAAPTNGDPYQGIRITPQAGAWSICLASFSGPEAPEFAHQMVAYIRNTYHIPCYVYDRADQQRRQENEAQRAYAQQHPGYRPKITRVEELCAILVGGYPDDKSANAALKQVQKWPTPEIHLPSGLPAFQTKYDMVFDKNGKPETDKDNKARYKTTLLNPCETAFAIHNPTLAEGQTGSKPKFDPAWRVINSDEKYSVYNCKKPWTLAIIQYHLFTGVQARTDKGGLPDSLWKGSHKNDELDTAAISAHNLAEVLRNMGMEAYVLHTQTGSIVTLGGFDAWNDNAIESTRQQLLTVRRKLEETARKEKLAAPPFFNKPLPMEVPR